MSFLLGGYLRSLEMHDSKGLLDRYIYGYDTQGNRTEIERTRRELKDISGKYTYDYDLEKRLINVRRDGALLRSYAYDAFGNRSIMTDEGVVTKYRYDELDRLLETVSDSKAMSYEYDKRGNIAKEYTDGLLQKTFTFDATNMLLKVVDAEGKEATYSYNGMGKRVAVQNPTESIDYLLDLTKDYHNMLERTVNGESENYTYDSNVVSMSKSGNDYFYMLDELGTGMYLTGTDGITTSTYAYDEFGRNINPFTGKKEKPAYTKQGNIIQPLAFTGYQHDKMTGSYFAQARYYDAGAGRFVSEDSVRGRINRPDTINHYLYCWNRPTSLRDLNGRDPIDEEFVGFNEGVQFYSTVYDSAKPVINKIDNDLEELSKQKHLIFVLGGSGSAGAMLYVSGGVQMVVDPLPQDLLKCIGFQVVVGGGTEIGASADGSVYIGTLMAYNIASTEGRGNEIGISGGEGIVPGGGVWFAGEGESAIYGAFASLGLGGEGTILEGHAAVSDTTKTFYPLDEIRKCINDVFGGDCKNE